MHGFDQDGAALNAPELCVLASFYIFAARAKLSPQKFADAHDDLPPRVISMLIAADGLAAANLITY